MAQTNRKGNARNVTTKLTTFEGFIIGGLAGCTAATVSNTAEVAKTRLQLQGELAKKGAPKVYNNVADVFVKTWRLEGIRGIQRGLTSAYAYQLVMNGSRIGFYEPFRNSLNKKLGYSPKEQRLSTSIPAGAAAGVIGSWLANPFFLVKARMQAYSPSLPVGTQRYYRHPLHALSTIIREEGFLGLTRGLDAATLRAICSSSAQVPSYMWAKQQIVSNGWAAPDSMWTYLASSSFSGIMMCIVMQPADTALTRLYNQPTVRDASGRQVGTLYRNLFDCLWKTLKAEGLFGWYKGSTAHFLRIAPHAIITMTSYDILAATYTKIAK